MRSSWLSTASAAFVCAAALANAAKLPAPLEQIHYDSTGNLVWHEDAEVVPSLGRPDFSGLTLNDVAASAIPAKEAADQVMTDAMKQAEDILSWTEFEVERIEHKIEDIMNGAKKSVKDWAHTGKVFVDGLEFERLTHPSFPSAVEGLSPLFRTCSYPRLSSRSARSMRRPARKTLPRPSRLAK